MRNPKRIIYTSSYDRGLEHLLAIWPEVKKEVPDAELHIFYGTKLFDQFYKDNPGSMGWKDKLFNNIQQEGITEHGRVSQEELVGEYKKSGIWAYPAHFGEINCISGLKAQAYGAVPVVISYAALEQTVQFGIKVTGDIWDPEVKKEYAKQLIWALNNPKWQEKVRKPMTEFFTENYAWDRVARQWSHIFDGVSVPPFHWGTPRDQIVKVIDGYTGKEIV